MNAKFILGTAFFLAQVSYASTVKKTSYDYKKPLEAVTVAVIDTGADIEHRDLKDFVWVNPGESGKDSKGRDKATNGIDDDDNGFVDDVHGWNFINNNNDVSDTQGHGTHVSGIIKTEFQKHTAGTDAPPLRLMILKYYSPEATDAENVLNTARAIEYATRMQARVINYSGGGSNPYLREFEAIKKAVASNILFVAAAGNNKTNTDKQGYYPANYPIKNIISVAASNSHGDLVSFSNYGRNTVDIVAPGEQIYSTLPHNRYGLMSGTSQSTAFVSGVAASLAARKAGYGLGNLVTDLLAGCRFNKALKGKTKFQLAMMTE